jgi:urate oxidase
MSRIISAHYGKANIPVMKIERGLQRHEVFQAVVSVDTEGEGIVDAYTGGDNSAIVATDTMKNFVYALLLDYPITSIEALARHLGQAMLRRYTTMSRVTVAVEQVAWEPISFGRAGPEAVDRISFQRRGGATDEARAVVDRRSTAIESRLRNLTLLKTTDSAFSGYVIDPFTTLPETEDRVLATSLSGRWQVRDGDLDYCALRERVVEILLEVFVHLKSRSVQHLAHEMASTVLRECPEVLEIELNLPNLHCNLLDLSPFGLVNRDTVYVPTEAPHGDLYVTLAR